MDINTNDASRFGDLTNLSTEKLQELEAVLATILALPAARETYAQIIDGTPIRSPRFGPVKASTLQGLETIVSGRTEPSDLALQQYDSIRIAFSAPQQLRIDSKARVSPLSRVHLPRSDFSPGSPKLPKCTTKYS